MVHTLAEIYVHFLEPALKVLAVIIAVALVLYLFNLLRGGDSKGGIASYVVNATFKTIAKSIKLIGVGIAKSAKMLLKITSLILATLRDFFTSKI